MKKPSPLGDYANSRYPCRNVLIQLIETIIHNALVALIVALAFCRLQCNRRVFAHCAAFLGSLVEDTSIHIYRHLNILSLSKSRLPYFLSVILKMGLGTAFHPFLRLPIELRRVIWRSAFDDIYFRKMERARPAETGNIFYRILHKAELGFEYFYRVELFLGLIVIAAIDNRRHQK